MDLASLRAQQIELASSVIREDRLDKDPPDLIAGAEVGFALGGEVPRAAMVLLKYPSLELVEYKVARIATTLPYIPGFLSFREYPALLAAWEMLSQKPDLVFVDGHGISNPRRLGVASHFGLLVDVPTIGVAKKRLCGKFEPLSSEPGALAPLMDKGEQLAWVWRSKAPDLIAGADVGFEQGGEVTRAAMVLLKYPSLELVEYKVARIATTMPYIPGFLSFREYPALLAAWEMLSQKPDLVFVDGHGISHPRRLGVASHFGLLVDVPTIGVAKKRLCGKFEPLSSEPGALAPLMDKGEQLAWVWRSKARCNPLFIATGHRVSVDSALAWVQRCMKGYRLAGVGTTLHERLSSAGANALGGRGGLGTSGVRALYSKSALIQVNCG